MIDDDYGWHILARDLWSQTNKERTEQQIAHEAARRFMEQMNAELQQP